MVPDRNNMIHQASLFPECDPADPVPTVTLPELACPRCHATRVILHWKEATNHAWHLGARCFGCDRHLKWLTQTSAILQIAPPKPDFGSAAIPTPAAPLNTVSHPAVTQL